MTKPPMTRWVRVRAAAGGLFALSIALSGCGGCETPGTDAGPDPEPEGEPEAEVVEIQSLDPAANDDTVESPFDATLSPDGTTVYYAALTVNEEGDNVPGVFSVPAAGGAPTALFTDEPLAQPVNLDIGLDGATLYIADGAALEDEDTSLTGAIFTLATAGGDASPIDATLGMSPGGVVVADVDGTEYVYFTGAQDDLTPGVFRFEPGGSIETVATGSPLDDPGGIAVTADGTVYVVDSAPGESFATLVKIDGDDTEVVLNDIGVGYPAGCALSLDETHLWISGLDPEGDSDRVYRLNLDTGAIGLVEDGISGFSESAGLHRAHDVDVFAWADSEANDTGTVYVLVP